MSLPKPLKIFMCVLISLHLSNIPSVAVAEELMISTSDVVANLDRTRAEESVKEYFSQAEVQQALIENGVSPEEVNARIASLSQSELNQLAGQIDQAKAGGDILVTILLIVLIIFLIKRI